MVRRHRCQIKFIGENSYNSLIAGANPVLTTAQFFLLLLGSADTKKKAKSRNSQVMRNVKEAHHILLGCIS